MLPFAILLTTGSALSGWIGLAVALAVVGTLSGFVQSRERRFALAAVLVGAASLVLAGRVWAVPYNCPSLWKYLGICG